jgi:hypothetical protein
LEDNVIKISFEVREINYEKCFESLIPKVTEECRSKEDPTEIDKLIVRLGDDAAAVVNKLMGFLDTDTRDEIIVWLLEKQQDVILDSVNKALQDMLGGDAVVIGTLYALDRPGTKISLHAGKVKTDSKKLAESPALTGISGGLAKLALKITDPETVEKEVIGLLSADYVKTRLISVLSDSLSKAGLHISLSDVTVRKDSGREMIPRMTDPEKDEGLLPDAIEDKIIDALAAWLKGSLK